MPWRPRKDAPFVSVHCSSLVPSLVEAELFGHGEGSLGGFSTARRGLLASAEDGTLFLDEIADLPLAQQDRLRLVLEKNVFWPSGSAAPVPFHARVIAATQHDLDGRVKAGTFREDLCLQLNVMQIKLPSLRERKRRYPALLVDSFLEKYAKPGSKIEFSPAAMKFLLAYDWPGNVQELENTVQRAISLASDPTVQLEDLGLNLLDESINESTGGDELFLDGLELEVRTIIRALRETAGDKTAAAHALGIGAATLYRRLKYYGLDAWL